MVWSSTRVHISKRCIISVCIVDVDMSSMTRHRRSKLFAAFEHHGTMVLRRESVRRPRRCGNVVVTCHEMIPVLCQVSRCVGHHPLDEGGKVMDLDKGLQQLGRLEASAGWHCDDGLEKIVFVLRRELDRDPPPRYDCCSEEVKETILMGRQRE